MEVINLKKYLPYAAIIVLIIVSAVVIAGKLKPSADQVSTENTEKTVFDLPGPSITPVEQIPLEDKKSVQAAIDAELNQLDKEISGIGTAELDAGGLADDQLGL
jgi:hypothetical protein